MLILPQLGHDGLYQRFNLNEPWDGPTNRPLAEIMPAVYAPVRPGPRPGETVDRAFSGPGAAVEPGRAVHPADVTDGRSRTVFAVEAREAVEWTKPDDLPFGPGVPVPALGDAAGGGEFHALMVDGTVRRVRGAVGLAAVRAAVTRAGGEREGLD